MLADLPYLSFLAFVGATAHGLMAGSDTQAAWVFWGYMVMTATVVFLVAYRVVLSVGSKVTAEKAARSSVPGSLGGGDGSG